GGEEISNIRKIAEIATDSLQPDITVVVDVPTEIGMERVGKEKDRMESKGFEFHKKIRNGYLDLAKEEKNAFVIDGTGEIAEIQKEVKDLFKNNFEL
ncbi:MAG: dTMP kinase, partial [Planctomycetota bacterium]